MTVQEMISEIKRLSLEERLELLKLLTHSLRDERQKRPREESSVNRVRGMLKPDGPIPSDSELNDEYTDYLVEKYT